MAKVLIEDTRNKPGKHAGKNEAWKADGVAVVRSKLPWGDYCLVPPVAVDTKMDIQELHADITQQHDRFKRECVGAREAGCQLVILVENRDGIRCLADLAAWSESEYSFKRRKRAQRPIDGGRLAKACATMSERYGVRFEFCKPTDAAARILEILEGKES